MANLNTDGIQVKDAANPKHEKTMRRLAALVGATDIGYKDAEPREVYTFRKPDGTIFRITFAGNKDQGGFLGGVEIFDEETRLWVDDTHGTKKDIHGTLVDSGTLGHG